jgi:Uma2 family endonuclease
MTTLVKADENILYPESDGQPMAENTEQYQWIVIIKENLEILFAKHPNIFIAADLFWYPVQVSVPPAPRQAPDVMVVFGRPKGRRGSYRQWQEGNIPVQVVFEILSPSNKTRDGQEDMDFKFMFYERYGVEEYYLYDPDEFVLQGWIRQGDTLNPIAQISDWTSPLLRIRFEWQPKTELQIYDPNGRKFLTSVELAQQAEQAQQQAELERQARLAAIPRLLTLGLSQEQVANALGLALEDIVQALQNPSF